MKISELDAIKKEKDSLQYQINDLQSTITTKEMENNSLMNEIERLKQEISNVSTPIVDENFIKQKFIDQILQLENEVKDLKGKFSISSKNLLFEQHKNQTMAHSHGMSHVYCSWHWN